MRYNDRKAKRLGKKEFSKNLINKELYEQWILDNPEYKGVSYSEYNLIWKQITEEIKDEIIINPQGVKLPFHCGEMIVQYLPKFFKAYDNVATGEFAERINYLNIATKGKVAKISWIRKLAARFNPYIILFALDQTRDMGKRLAKQLEINPEIFRNSNMKTYDNKQRDNI